VIVLSGSCCRSTSSRRLRPFLHFQPLAGLVDIPFAFYFANLAGGGGAAGLALQAGWTWCSSASGASPWSA